MHRIGKKYFLIIKGPLYTISSDFIAFIVFVLVF